MKTLCKHEVHRVIDDIWQPRYHDRKVLINVNKIRPGIEHYLIKFSKAPAYPDWYYLNSKSIKKGATQKNGNGEMYIVSLDELEDFKPITECEHNA